MRNEPELHCRVCGYQFSKPPWGMDGKSPEYWFCPCCGVESGYGDFTYVAAVRWREKWIANGAKWDEPNLRPPDWDLERQLADVPDAFK